MAPAPTRRSRRSSSSASPPARQPCQARHRHARGLSTNRIARELGVPRGQVAPLVRDVSRHRAANAPEPAVVGCWVSPGWSVGLTVDPDRGWQDRPEHGVDSSGLVGVLVAREPRHGGTSVSVCGYPVDTYCLGVKDALGPRSVRRSGLDRFVDRIVRALLRRSVGPDGFHVTLVAGDVAATTFAPA